MNTEITNAINASKDKSQYDTHAKRLLSQKIILAHILVKVIDEFKDMKPEQVMAYIEGDPIIGTIPDKNHYQYCNDWDCQRTAKT